MSGPRTLQILLGTIFGAAFALIVCGVSWAASLVVLISPVPFLFFDSAWELAGKDDTIDKIRGGLSFTAGVSSLVAIAVLIEMISEQRVIDLMIRHIITDEQRILELLKLGASNF